MSTRLKAGIEAAIQKWMDAECEAEDWPDAYIAPTTVIRMTEAAYAVFMANAEGQQFSEEQG
jgi:hypothetical protein